MVNSSPEQVATIFQSQPNLAYASVQALLLMGIVDENVLSVVAANQTSSVVDIIAKVKESRGTPEQPVSSGTGGFDNRNSSIPTRRDNPSGPNNSRMATPPTESYNNGDSSNRFDPRLRKNNSAPSNRGKYEPNNNSPRYQPNRNQARPPQAPGPSQNQGKYPLQNQNQNQIQSQSPSPSQIQNQNQNQNPYNQMDQQAMVAQILQLTDDQIQSLPDDQRAMVQMLKANYGQS